MELKLKPHILIFIDWYAPAYKAGGPIRSVLNLVEALQGTYVFSIVCSDRDYGDKLPFENVVPDTWNQISDFVRVLYLSPEYRKVSFYEKLLKEETFYAVHLNGIFSTQFSIRPLIALRKVGFKGKVIVSPRGMLHSSALKVKATKKLFFLKLVRLMGWYKKVVFHSTNNEETMEIRNNLGKDYTIIEAPNLPLKVLDFDTLHKKQKEQNKLSIICISRISEEKNTLFLLEILSKIDFPITFKFYGAPRSNADWEEFNKKLSLLPQNINFEYNEKILPNELVTVLSQFNIFFLPTKGENFGHAIFEALSCGLPVVISNNTPWKNLEEKKAGFDLQLSQKESFIDSIRYFYSMDAKTFSEWQICSHKLAMDFYNAISAVEAYNKLYL